MILKCFWKKVYTGISICLFWVKAFCNYVIYVILFIMRVSHKRKNEEEYVRDRWSWEKYTEVRMKYQAGEIKLLDAAKECNMASSTFFTKYYFC